MSGTWKKKTALIACLLAAIGCLSGCTGSSAMQNANVKYSDTGLYFDTIIKITVYDAKDEPLIADCFAMAETYEQMWSRTIPDSDVSTINAANGSYVTVDPETITLIEKGIVFSELSDGAFDLTVGALSDLWDISNNPGVIPDQRRIDEAKDTIGYGYISVSGNQVALTHEGTKIDLGAIAKGYIADQMKKYLLEHDVVSAMINLGGNVLVIGNKPDGTAFQVGIQRPFDETNASIASIPLTDQTMVSSGNYERYFEKDGIIYHHIIDTATGYPVENDLLSVTIVCDQSVDGDGYSTVCFSLGLEQGMKLIEETDGVEAVFITDDYELHATSGIRSRVKEIK